MGLNLKNVLQSGLFIGLFAGALSAAPQLRITQSTVGPLSIAQGQNGLTQTIYAANTGDGTLNLTATSSVPWITATVGTGTAGCSIKTTCTPVQIVLNTASLAAGTYTGIVTLSDPNALDAPQTVTVTVQIGGGVPNNLTFFVAPGGSVTSNFVSGGNLTTKINTQSGGPTVSLAVNGSGSFQFSVPYQITVNAPAGTATGSYTGSLITSGSSFGGDNKTIPVTFQVTTQPIAQTNPTSLQFRVAPGTTKQTKYISVGNAGLGTLSLTSATAATTSGGSFLTANATGQTVAVTADSTGLSPGVYNGTVTLASNAANGPTVVPVELDVVASGPPVAFFQGVVDNATFLAGPLAQGDIVALFGDQLTGGDAAFASALPLAQSLGGVRVLVNGAPAPVYYSSYNQINFQIPYETATGNATVQVERNGQVGNTISIVVAAAAPRILRLGIGNYGLLVNSQDQSFPIPTTSGLNSHPAKVGDVLTIYALGLGVTTPAVASGAGAPAAEPFARVTPKPQVCFAASPFSPPLCVDPQFAGLTPNFVGLYQINFGIPQGAPIGDQVPLYLQSAGAVVSNTVQIAIH